MSEKCGGTPRKPNWRSAGQGPGPCIIWHTKTPKCGQHTSGEHNCISCFGCPDCIDEEKTYGENAPLQLEEVKRLIAELETALVELFHHPMTASWRNEFIRELEALNTADTLYQDILLLKKALEKGKMDGGGGGSYHEISRPWFWLGP